MNNPANRPFNWTISAIPLAAASTLFQASPAMVGSNMTAKSAPKMTPATPSAPHAYFDDRLLKAEIAASEARTDTKFAQLIGKIDILSNNVDTLSTNVKDSAAYSRSMKWQLMIAIFAAIIALGGVVYSAAGVALGGMGVTASAFQAGMAAAQTQPHGKR